MSEPVYVLTPRSPEAVLADPRWDDDPVGLYDAMVANLGAMTAETVWMAACRLCDERAGEA